MALDYTPAVMICAFTLGIVLIILSATIDQNQSKLCLSSKIRSANLATMGIAVGLLTATCSYFICRATCKQFATSPFSLNLYLGTMLLFGVALTICGSMIVSDSDNVLCTVKSQGGWVTAIGVVLIVVPVIYVAATRLSVR